MDAKRERGIRGVRILKALRNSIWICQLAWKAGLNLLPNITHGSHLSLLQEVFFNLFRKFSDGTQGWVSQNLPVTIQPKKLASPGATAINSPNGNWLPLGVFAFTQPDQTSSDVSIQLAVDKQGLIRGNDTDKRRNFGM
jgi:hypothetical protein